ncbi:hypothetical protein MRX96_040020 [Rhipicephalus microplus]
MLSILRAAARLSGPWRLIQRSRRVPFPLAFGVAYDNTREGLLFCFDCVARKRQQPKPAALVGCREGLLSCRDRGRRVCVRAIWLVIVLKTGCSSSSRGLLKGARKGALLPLARWRPRLG